MGCNADLFGSSFLHNPSSWDGHTGRPLTSIYSAYLENTCAWTLIAGAAGGRWPLIGRLQVRGRDG